MFKHLFNLLILSSMTSFVTATDWQMVNYNIKNTRSNPYETTLKPSNVSGLTQKWFYTLPLGVSVQGAPIVVNGIVYFGDSSGLVHAVNATTGADSVTPYQTLGSIDGPVLFNNNVIYFVSAPAYNGLTSSPLYLYALNATTLQPLAGYPVTINDPAFPINNVTADVLAGPVLAGINQNILIIAFTNTDAEETATLFPTFKGGWIAYDLTKAPGTILWTLIPLLDSVATGVGSWSTAAIDNKLGYMFAGTTNATTPPAGKLSDALLAIDYTTGKIVWSRQYTKNDVFSLPYGCGKDFDLGASPNLFSIRKDGKKIDVVGANNKGGIYRVWERKSGKLVWSSPTTDPIRPSSNGCPSAAYANGIVYTIANQSNSPVPTNIASILAEYGLTFGSEAALLYLIENSQLKDQTYIRAHNARTGKILWSTNQIVSSFPSITEANGVLYTGNFLGEFRALNAKTGNLLYSTYPAGQNPDGFPNAFIGGPITVVNGQVFISMMSYQAAAGVVMYSLP